MVPYGVPRNHPFWVFWRPIFGPFWDVPFLSLQNPGIGLWTSRNGTPDESFRGTYPYRGYPPNGRFGDPFWEVSNHGISHPPDLSRIYGSWDMASPGATLPGDLGTLGSYGSWVLVIVDPLD